jgi:hypothetical protein
LKRRPKETASGIMDSAAESPVAEVDTELATGENGDSVNSSSVDI